MTATHVIATGSAAQTVRAGKALAPLLRANDVLILSGDLGAGKTTLTQGVALGLGVDGPVVSPTFNILVVHPGRLTLHHLDLYRLVREAELEDIDFFGTLEAGGVSLVEWGDRFPGALPPDRVEVALRISGDESRVIEVRGTGDRSRLLASAWAAAAETAGPS